MTSPHRVSDPAPARDGPRVAPGRMRAPQGRRCAQCGAVGTHYLTCPSLRLPAHYRVGADIAPACPCDLPAPACPAPAGPATGPAACCGQPRSRPGGGPDHPDWPRPPQG
jgi:hypothetical protein